MKSKNFILLSIISLFLSGFGIGLLFAIPVFFLIIYVLIEITLFSLIKFIIIRSNSRLARFLSLIPRVDFNGKWFMEQNPVEIEVETPPKLFKFIIKNIWEMILIQVSAFIVGLRIIINIRSINIQNTYPFGLSFSDFVAVQIISYIISILYFTIVWSMRDTGLKLINEEISTIGKSREMISVKSLSDSYQSLFGYVLGVPAIFWLIDFMNVNRITIFSNNPSINIIIAISFIVFFSLGGILFLAISLLISKQYQKLVNDLRIWILNSTRHEFEFKPVLIPEKNIFENPVQML